MKTSRIAALALIATASFGFNAFAGEGTDGYQSNFTQQSVSTLSSAAVRAEGVQASLERTQRGYNAETGEFTVTKPTVQSSTLTREVVRADALKARGMQAHIIGEIG